MAIKADLSADRERGAGYGLLRISGLGEAIWGEATRGEAAGGETTGPIDFSLMRNQGTQPYLGRGRMWQASEAWHAANEARVEGDAVVIPVGPDIVDAIVGQPANVAYRLTLTTGARKHVATLTVHRPLLGSGAAAPDDTVLLEQRQREEEARRAREEEDAARRAAEEEEARRAALAAEEETRWREESAIDLAPHDPEPRKTRGRWPAIVALLALLALIGGTGAWFGCWIEGFGPPACAAKPSEPIAVVEPPVEAELSCAGLTDANACFQVAQKALEQKQLEPARQLFQQAADMGSLEANVAVARMYDPATWSAETSPVAAASWETAVYWYEKAARQGDGAAQLQAGKLLCQNAPTEFEKTQGRSYLDQASKAGSAEAQTLLADCQ